MAQQDNKKSSLPATSTPSTVLVNPWATKERTAARKAAASLQAIKMLLASNRTIKPMRSIPITKKPTQSTSKHMIEPPRRKVKKFTHWRVNITEPAGSEDEDLQPSTSLETADSITASIYRQELLKQHNIAQNLSDISLDVDNNDAILTPVTKISYTKDFGHFVDPLTGDQLSIVEDEE